MLKSTQNRLGRPKCLIFKGVLTLLNNIHLLIKNYENVTTRFFFVQT